MIFVSFGVWLNLEIRMIVNMWMWWVFEVWIGLFILYVYVFVCKNRSLCIINVLRVIIELFEYF